MLFFSRKKKEKEEEENRSSKKSKRKKKEEQKPWGKKERILMLALLLLTSGTSGILALSSRSWKLPGLPRVSLPNLDFFGEETYVIEGDSQLQEEKGKVISYFENYTADLTGVYAFYLVDLEQGFAYGVRENEEFIPASLNKLPVIITLYKQAELGEIDLDVEYELKQSDKLQGAGSLRNQPAGYKINYRDLARLMGKESDNTAFNIIRNTLGEDKIRKTIDDLGLFDTEITSDEQSTTAQDMGILFEKLWSSDYLTSKSKEEILEFLTDTNYETWMAAGMPSDIRVAHKIGLETNVLHDAGIIYSEPPFVLVLLSKGIVKSEADQAFVDITGEIFDIRSR